MEIVIIVAAALVILWLLLRFLASILAVLVDVAAFGIRLLTLFLGGVALGVQWVTDKVSSRRLRPPPPG